MMSRRLDHRFTEHKECSICLGDFKEGNRVTPLPCDSRHYFHTECIKEWAKHRVYCPLCNKKFTAKQLTSLNRRFTKMVKPKAKAKHNEIEDKDIEIKS